MFEVLSIEVEAEDGLLNDLIGWDSIAEDVVLPSGSYIVLTKFINTVCAS